MSRQYGLPCPVARSLDIIGDRWTLLIIRDLLAIRASIESSLCDSHALDADSIRESPAIPEAVRFHLGLLDSLIGTYMLQTASVHVFGAA